MRRRIVHGGQQPRVPRARRTLVGAVMAAVSVAALGAPAQANSSGAPAQNWVLGYTDSTTTTPDFAQPGDVISISKLNLAFTYTYNGSAMTINCVNVPITGFTYTVPGAGAPYGAAGGTITVKWDPPTSTLSGCADSVVGGPVNFSFVSGSQWTLAIKVPVAVGTATGQTASGSPTGTITVPDGNPSGAGNGTVIANMTTWNGDGGVPPCTFQGPASNDLTVPLSYNPSTGVATNIAAKAFAINNGSAPPSGTPANVAACSQVGAAMVLQSASVTLAGPSGKTPTMVWEQ